MTSDGMNSTLMRLEILSSTLCNPFQNKLPKCNAIRWQSEFHKTNHVSNSISAANMISWKNVTKFMTSQWRIFSLY
ncbi:hypothetical protein T08_11260 [Trichinella sp. T8]|nr:hypothetical protein T08_11260 [Trichinella sp. T8]